MDQAKTTKAFQRILRVLQTLTDEERDVVLRALAVFSEGR